MTGARLSEEGVGWSRWMRTFVTANRDLFLCSPSRGNLAITHFARVLNTLHPRRCDNPGIKVPCVIPQKELCFKDHRRRRVCYFVLVFWPGWMGRFTNVPILKHMLFSLPGTLGSSHNYFLLHPSHLKLEPIFCRNPSWLPSPGLAATSLGFPMLVFFF